MWGEGGHRPLSAFQAPSVGSVFTSSLFRLVLLASTSPFTQRPPIQIGSIRWSR